MRATPQKLHGNLIIFGQQILAKRAFNIFLPGNIDGIPAEGGADASAGHATSQPFAHAQIFHMHLRKFIEVMPLGE